MRTSNVLPRVTTPGSTPTVGFAGLSPIAAVMSLALVSFALCWPQMQDVWNTGTFYDTDDAMRMVQVRAWLDGQSWFDLTAHRIDPPQGLLMHWSRLVDVPLGALIRLFSFALNDQAAERLTRIVFPLALQVALIAAAVFTGRTLAGPVATLPSAILIVGTGFQFGQFVPGRIDHHAPQIVLLMVMAGSAADVVLKGRTRSAAWAAMSIACSVAISLENLPFIAVVVAVLGLTWALLGGAQAQALRAFGGRLIIGVLGFFVATIPPLRYLTVTPDALSLPHLLAAVLGGGALIILAALSPRLFTAASRLGALAIAGTLVLGIVVLSCPDVLQSPYAGLDPVVRTLWLSHVAEARPLFEAVALQPQNLSLIVLPIVAGMLGIAWLTLSSQGKLKAAWALVGALTFVGLAGSCWELRVASSTMPLAVVGGIGVVSAILTSWRHGVGRPPMAVAVSCAVGLLFSPFAWLALPVADGPAASQEAAACRAADNLKPLGRLAPGVIFASIDSGSHVLAYTSLSVIGAPYHRNNSGNRAVLDGFTAASDDAAALVRTTGARYLALCPGQGVENQAMLALNPHGLAAEILAGRPPAWLERLDVPGTTYQVFAVH